MTTATRHKVTARDMLAALYRHFDGSWAMLTEVTARPKPRSVGEPFHAVPRQRDRRIDVLLVRPDRRSKAPTPNLLHRPRPEAEPTMPGLFPPPPVKPQPAAGDGPLIERLAIEVKVTRADFLSDVRNPAKQAPWRELAHRHAYAVPTGLVRLDEVPAGSGLIEVKFGQPGDRPVVAFTRRAPRSAHDPGPMPFPNIMDAFWRTARLEAETKGYGYEPDADDDPDKLRADNQRLRHELDLERGRSERYAEKCREWQKRWARLEPPACSTCGKPLHINRGRDVRMGREWEHRDEGDASMCLVLRTAAAERESAEYGGRFRDTWVRGPEPVDPAGEETPRD